VKEEDALWQMLLHHQSPRLNSAISDLRQQLLENFKHFLPQEPPENSSGILVLTVADTAILGFDESLGVLAHFSFQGRQFGNEQAQSGL
jgi:hypothetical protein